MKILILNGSLHGANGNCAIVIQSIQTILQSQTNEEFKVLELKVELSLQEIEKSLLWADAFIFVTGTYWDSWSHQLQYFLEQVTEFEVQPHFLGKPAMACILMHSVGGKSVLSRLQGVLTTLGCLIPPLSGIVISSATQKANGATNFKLEQDNRSTLSGENLSLLENDDYWSLNDLPISINNLLFYAQINLKMTGEFANNLFSSSSSSLIPTSVSTPSSLDCEKDSKTEKLGTTLQKWEVDRENFRKIWIEKKL